MVATQRLRRRQTSVHTRLRAGRVRRQLRGRCQSLERRRHRVLASSGLLVTLRSTGLSSFLGCLWRLPTYLHGQNMDPFISRNRQCDQIWRNFAILAII